MDYQVHPVPLVNAQDLVDAFVAQQPSGEYSLAADDRTSSIVAVAPPDVQKALAAFIEAETAARMRRFVVEMQVRHVTPGGDRLMGKPRIEVPFGKTGTIHLDGRHMGGRVDWQSRLEVSPELDENGRVRVHLRGGQDEDRDGADVSLTILPGEPLLIDERRATTPEVRAFAKELNAGRDAAPYSVTLSIRPL